MSVKQAGLPDWKAVCVCVLIVAVSTGLGLPAIVL